MAKVIAKAKKKRKLQEEAEAKADGLINAPAIESKNRLPKLGVPVSEIRNVIAGSFERLWEELNATGSFRGTEHMRANAEANADYITGSLTYGLHGYGPAVKIREAEATPRYCKEHK